MKDLNWQLGYICGEHYADYEMPTLSTDMLTSDNIIPVPLDLYKEWMKKVEYWESLKEGSLKAEVFESNKEWYTKNIVKKFLEKEIKTVFYVQPTNVELFVKGFATALSDTDMSHYACEYAKKGEFVGDSLELTLKLKYND